MRKKVIIKMVSGIVIFTFVFSFAHISPFLNKVNAANELNWENPNKNGDNPYKINTDVILNSQTMMQVVGCTGLVDTVTTWTTDFLKKQANKAILRALKVKSKAEVKNKSCEAIKAAIVAALAPVQNTQYSLAAESKIDCKRIQETVDTDTTDAIKEQTKSQDAAKKREECFNGLAYTLAKNQLTSMTRQTINWVNTGFNGNPMYVQNMTSLNNSISKNILETGIEELSNGAFPYGRDFSRSLVRSYNTGGIGYNSSNFLKSLQSDLAFFITDEDSYTSYDITGSQETNELRRAQEANNRFAEDFTTGGWDGWLALTQRDQNNPLGFTMQASEYLANRIEQQSNETKDEVMQNNGFLSQKECILWREYDEDGPVQYEEWDPATDTYEWTYNDRENKDSDGFDKCMDWRIVTPGSIIKEKLTTYINSPERQLELADTINESLNNLFSMLIEKFRDEGLFGLSRDKYVYENDSMGMGGYGNVNYDDVNSIDNSTSGGYNGSFDLTRDLGNSYLHEPTTELGKWDAKKNVPELHIGLGPYNEIQKGYYPPNVYYTVSIPGNTQLFYGGYNGWATGDRAFWNGSEWQNWKAGQTSPVTQRGIIQTQKDYVVAAKEILKVLPGIMPKLGELDYCIPGPNPYFEINSGYTAGTFNEYAGSLQSLYKDGSFFKRDTTTFSIAKPGNTEYENYINIFKKDTNNDGYMDSFQDESWWEGVRKTIPWISLQELGLRGEVKQDRSEERTQNAVDSLINQIQQDIKDFYKKYKTNVFDGIYGKILNEFIQKENKDSLENNPSYIPMAQEGYNITKDMLTYDEDITTAVEDYNAAIIQAESNTQKLNNIKNQVSKIIKAAQTRRDAALLEKIKKDKCTSEYNKCINSVNINTGDDKTTFRFINRVTATPKNECEAQYENCINTPVSQADKLAYLAKYAECFDEENISYYDDTDIIEDTGGDEGTRCYDNIDNDLDGLIDWKDPDCQSTNVSTEKKHCVLGVETTNSMNMPSNKKCSDRKTESECLNTDYYHGTLANVCNWTTETGITPPTTSLYGCRIDDKIKPKPDNNPENKNCLLRTEGECTLNKYIDNSGMGYTCKFVPF